MGVFAHGRFGRWKRTFCIAFGRNKTFRPTKELSISVNWRSPLAQKFRTMAPEDCRVNFHWRSTKIHI